MLSLRRFLRKFSVWRKNRRWAKNWDYPTEKDFLSCSKCGDTIRPGDWVCVGYTCARPECCEMIGGFVGYLGKNREIWTPKKFQEYTRFRS